MRGRDPRNRSYAVDIRVVVANDSEHEAISVLVDWRNAWLVFTTGYSLATKGSAFISSYAKASTRGVNQSPRMPNVVTVQTRVVEDLALLGFTPSRLRRRNRCDYVEWCINSGNGWYGIVRA